MPLGASLLMKGLGMRETDRYIQEQRRSRGKTTSYDRPQALPDKLYRGRRLMNSDGMDSKNAEYLGDPGFYRAGLPEKDIDRLFDYERSQWPQLGFVSPYKDQRGRVKRELEHQLWLHWYQLRGRLGEEFMDWHNRKDGTRSRGRRRGDNGKRDRSHGRGRYNDPPYRQPRLVDIRNPKFCPPFPGGPVLHGGTLSPGFVDMDEFLAANHLTQFPDVRRKFRGLGSSNHGPFGIHGGAVPHKSIRQPSVKFGPVPLGRHPGKHDGYNPEDDVFNSPFGIPHGHHPRHDEEEFEDDDDTDTEYSSESYDRGRHPRIVFPTLAPYHSRPLRHGPRGHRRDYDDIDIDDDDDEVDFEDIDGHMPLRRKRGHNGRRRGMGAHGGAGPFGFMPRYRNGDLDFGLSGDEEDDFDLHGY